MVLIPFIDRGVIVDLREFYLEIPRQDSITKDNAAIAIDFIMYYKVFDAATSVIGVSNFAGAATNIAATTLRAVVGDISLDDVLAKRDEINSLLRVKLDEVTERWGVKVTNVEIREIIPPPFVQEAMTRQMSAERTRRAVVTEADGKKQAAITIAEGNKESAILNAEGSKQSAILTAEGERQAAILRAEGFSNGPGQDLRGREHGRREDDAPAVPRHPEAGGRVAVVEGRGSDGALGPGGDLHGARRGRVHERVERGRQLRIASAAPAPREGCRNRGTVRGVRGRDRDAAHRAGLLAGGGARRPRPRRRRARLRRTRDALSGARRARCPFRRAGCRRRRRGPGGVRESVVRDASVPPGGSVQAVDLSDRGERSEEPDPLCPAAANRWCCGKRPQAGTIGRSRRPRVRCSLARMPRPWCAR